MWYLWGTGKVYTGFWWGDLMERDHLEDLGADGRVILKWIGMGKHGLDFSGSE
jgi:hypothetical protein